jgi:hypothetical protein
VTRWYGDPAARFVIGLRYVPWLAALSLGWEIAQLPLYTLWSDAEPAYVAYAVAHCTAGDILIGSAALLLALALVREGRLAGWRRGRLAVLTALLGVSYTVFSEWMNVAVLRNWGYAPTMPTLELGGIEIGVSPLAQWLVVPPTALYGSTRRKASS